MMETTFITIFEEISKYYPIGISPYNPIYYEFSGAETREKLCHEKMGKEVYNYWKSLVKGLKSELPEVISASSESSLLEPCYTGRLLIARKEDDSVLTEREVVFHLSILAPYFAVYAIDKVSLKSLGSMVVFEPVLYNCPNENFDKYFKIIKDNITKKYENYICLPNTLLAMRINSLIVPAPVIKNKQDSSIFQALFSSEDITIYKTII